MRAVDTNLLVRLIVQDDQRQTAQALRAIAAGGWVTSLVLAESIWVLKSYYRRGREEIARTVAVLLKHDTLVLQDAEAVVAALALFEANKGVEFTDCLILEIALKAGHGPLCTFDRALAKLDGVERA